MGKAEGDDELWHGHVTAVTVSPDFRRIGLANQLMDILEQVSEKIYNTYFVDLFVRVSNLVAIGMYEGFGYSVYRRVLGYYTGPDGEDAFGNISLTLICGKLYPETIFNPKLRGKSESTADMLRQVLYFYPPTSADEVTRQVGLAQGMESFTAKFTKSNYNIFRTGKTISILYKTDEFHYLIKLRMAASAYTKGNKKYAEYFTSDEAVISLARKSHSRYCLFNDTEEFKFLYKVDTKGKGRLKDSEPLNTDEQSVRGALANFDEHLDRYKQKLESFFTCYVQSIDFKNLEVAALEGILGYNLHRSVYSIINKISIITTTNVTLLYKNALVYSGLEKYEYIYDLYDYLVDSESGKYDDFIINQAAISARMYTFLHSAGSPVGTPFTGFLIGPETLDQMEQKVVPKIIYFGKVPHIIITYQLHELLTITFTSKQIDLEKFHQLSYYAFLQSCIHELFTPLLNIPERSNSAMYYCTVQNKNTHNIQIGSSNNRIKHKIKKMFLQKNHDLESYTNVEDGWLCVIKDGDRDITVYVDKEVGLDRIQDLSTLIKEIRNEFKENDITQTDVEKLKVLMSSYKSNRLDYAKYALFDSKKYTRNLIDDGNGKYNLIALCWGPGQTSPIHNHANSHCIFKVLEGQLTEVLYPSEQGRLPKISKYTENQVNYMHDKIGTHRVGNDSSEPAISLHLYSPPIEYCKIYDEKGNESLSGKTTFYSVNGVRVDAAAHLKSKYQSEPANPPSRTRLPKLSGVKGVQPSLPTPLSPTALPKEFEYFSGFPIT
ncbi:hypothetical protein HK103_000182 [Boothiomyces macroporosus]|uniref:cysteine dioxygenase n=1 Tax=Boothiomyces macroporosus TaxID=261099 RepID=A0AAD5UQ12_9FUNG|nr:hypothetical protein HK103_000182 [Boothiomyces macroporosus]